MPAWLGVLASRANQGGGGGEGLWGRFIECSQPSWSINLAVFYMDNLRR